MGRYRCSRCGCKECVCGTKYDLMSPRAPKEKKMGKTKAKLIVEVVEKQTWKFRENDHKIIVEHHDCSKPIEQQTVRIEVGYHDPDPRCTAYTSESITLSVEQARELCKTILASLPKAKVYRTTRSAADYSDEHVFQRENFFIIEGD